ncbi:hypothetical protein F0U60_16985 [Archangium minus]|uniref:Large ribosomal subunit protein bL12 C-terminal domain-containing protein n=1 Tax=Archangium minus TaxID=83450 RepID=A0ABY9WPM3_9BACT|nr:hypothetical protein F0U60_16985 [Archangium minus]
MLEEMIPGPELVIACPACRALHRYDSLRSGNTFGAWRWTDGRVVSPMLPDRPSITRCHQCGGFFWVYRAEEVGSIENAPLDKSVYEVLLEQVGARRVEVMARLREHSKQGLAEVKALLARTPVVAARNLSEHEAQRLVLSLQEVGASASLRRQVSDAEGTFVETPPEWMAAPYVTHLTEQELLAALAAGVAESWEEASYLRIQAWWASNEPFRQQDVPWVPWAERAPEARENLRALADRLPVEDPFDLLMKAEAFRELERFEEAIALLRTRLPEDFARTAGFLRELAEQRIAELRLLPSTERREPERSP